MQNTYDEFISDALTEDVGSGDHTSNATISPTLQGSARLLVKEGGVLCGCNLAERIFYLVDKSITFELRINDRDFVNPGDIPFIVTGPVRSILLAERLVLNCMQRLSGIATQTRKYVAAVEGTKAKILDTRKTTPLLRGLEKYAVLCGGGHNHRFGLYDMILIKDNHIDACGSISKALIAAKEYIERNNLQLKIEVETRTIHDVEEAIKTGIPHRIMFDNFNPDTTRAAVNLVNGQVECESSGGITLNSIRSFAETGIDYISVGALTHSISSLDLSLKIIK
jgi:nicotinate-nucleotide pyrophosphorylase (carboxylating)